MADEHFFSQYTLGDIAGLVPEQIITYPECAEIMEEELLRRFPSLTATADRLYGSIRHSCRCPDGTLDYQRYCAELCSLERELQYPSFSKTA